MRAIAQRPMGILTCADEGFNADFRDMPRVREMPAEVRNLPAKYAKGREKE